MPAQEASDDGAWGLFSLKVRCHKARKHLASTFRLCPNDLRPLAGDPCVPHLPQGQPGPGGGTDGSNINAWWDCLMCGGDGGPEYVETPRVVRGFPAKVDLRPEKAPVGQDPVGLNASFASNTSGHNSSFKSAASVGRLAQHACCTRGGLRANAQG